MRTIAVRAFDFHCHIDLLPDPAAQIASCDRQQVVTLAVTTTPKAWRQNAAWTENSQYVYPAVGLHPQLVPERTNELALLERLMEQTPFVGEVGLDGGPEFRQTFSVQRRVFRSILTVANRLGGRVLSIHSRRAVDAVLTEIEACTTGDRITPVLHWFSGSKAAARRAARMGCYFSVNQRTLDHEKGRTLVQGLPLDRILTETDAPFGCRLQGSGRLVDAVMTLDKLAAVKGEEPHRIAAAIAANATRVFAFAGKSTQFEAVPRLTECL